MPNSPALHSGYFQTGTGTHCEVGQLVVGAMWVNAVEVSPRHISPPNDQRRAHMTLVPKTQPLSIQDQMVRIWHLLCLQLT